MKTIYKTTSDNITVTIRIPENIPEHIVQEKINYIYDVLKPKNSEKNLQQTT